MNLRKTSEGVWEAEKKVGSIKDFYELIEDNFNLGKGNGNKCSLKDYVWREQRRRWPLKSSFDRIYKGPDRSLRDKVVARHRQVFLYAARGRTDRLGMSIAELKHYVNSRTLNENHLWAFGQHYGLATPLLDWTVSPYAALFFACEKEHNDHPEIEDGEENAKYRYVYGLKFKELREKSKKLSKSDKSAAPVEFFSPMSSEFGRLVTQRGIFTITEDGGDIQGWVENLCKLFEDPSYPILIKIKIINENRVELLRWLNTMNINRHTLYPDIEGAAEFSNLGLELDHGYADAIVPCVELVG